MPLTSPRLSRTLIAVTAATAPVVALAPSAQAAPPNAPQLPKQPLVPAAPQAPVATQPRILPTPAPDTTVTMWVDVAAGVNARTGPSTSYSVAGGYRQGTKLTGTLTSNNWLKLSGNRFVAAWNLTSDNPNAGSGGGGSSSQSVTRWMAASVGNVRSGPGLGYSVVTTMRQGTEVSGTWTSNGWLNIGGGKYISGTILTSSDPGGGSSGGGSSSQSVTRWMAASVGNVRSGPGLGYSVVTTMRQGTEVSGTWTSNGWLNIGGGKYISGTILTSSDPGGGSSGGSTDPAPTVTRWVSVPVANVRSGPSTSYSVVGTKTAGAQVSGTLQSNGWLKLSGSQYMAGSVLTDDEPGSGVAPTPAPTASRQAILNTAAQYVGYPYVLYGTPPNAFDCSSYTWWVYKQNGITIPRTVRDQRTHVIPVSNPQPGDLVFYKNWYHVGIYAGPGMSYEAQNPDADVVYGPIWDEVWYGRVPGM